MQIRHKILIVFIASILLMGILRYYDSRTQIQTSLVYFPMSQCAKSEDTEEALRKESAEILKRGEDNAVLYELKPNETLKEITDRLLTHPHTSEAVKKNIQDKKHRYYVFSYLSDGYKVKGYIAVPVSVTQPIPVIYLLRGGNRLFGLPIPAQLSTQEGYAVVVTTYRGGVSEGKDEFGGNDVNDVVNLLYYMPQLEKELKIQFDKKHSYMVGVSRGGMQLFLALGRYPEIQKFIRKVAVISGLLNIEQAVKDRADFKAMLMENFGLTDDEKGAHWLANRDPRRYVANFPKTMPIMIAQGTQDTRVCLKEGYDMLQALHDKELNVTYVEIEGGDHVLINAPDFNQVLFNWLEQED